MTDPVRSDSGWWYQETPRSALAGALVAMVGAVVIGGLTSFAQQLLPETLRSLSNSAGGWTMFSFLVIWLSRARPLLAAGLGVVAFELLIEAYGAVTGWRGYSTGAPFTSRWTAVGFVAGPVLGAAASLSRYGSPLWRALGVAPLSAVLLGEGVWALSAIANTTGILYWIVEIVLSVLFLALAIVRGRLGYQPKSIVLGVWVLGSVAFVGAESFILN
jgi:hypothetical protein